MTEKQKPLNRQCRRCIAHKKQHLTCGGLAYCKVDKEKRGKTKYDDF